VRINLDSYINLISDFLSGKISAKCFEYTYLKLFKEEKGERSELEFPILNTLFLDVDDFCSDPALLDERDIGETELKGRCKVALEKLRQLKEKN